MNALEVGGRHVTPHLCHSQSQVLREFVAVDNRAHFSQQALLRRLVDFLNDPCKVLGFQEGRELLDATKASLQVLIHSL